MIHADTVLPPYDPIAFLPDDKDGDRRPWDLRVGLRVM